jgi:predicted permease
MSGAIIRAALLGTLKEPLTHILHRLRSALRWLVRRDRAERELDDELRMFIDLAAADRVRDGETPIEARRRALIQLGGIDQVKERVRSGRHGAWLDGVRRDVRYALRQLRRHPVFSTVAIATLGLGIGVNTAMFGLVHQMLIAELPVREPERLVVLTRSNAEQRDQARFDYAFFRELDDEARDVFAEVLSRAAGSERVTVGTDRGGVAAIGELVSGSYFEVLGVQPFLGRLFTRNDDVTPGAHPVVVLSHSFWQRQFGGDPGVIDRTVRITGVPMTIVGVLPREFTGLDPAQRADLRVPIAMHAEVRGGPGRERKPAPLPDGASAVIVLGRLRPGVTPAQASQALTSRYQRYLEQRTAGRAGAPSVGSERVHVEAAATGIGVARRQYRTSLRVLMAATTSVLVIACLNLANLLLVRASARRNEFALRRALGASPAQLVRQLLAESSVLSLAGAALGGAVAYPFTALLIRLAAADDAAAALTPRPAAAVLLFHAGATLACAILCGLLPALAARRYRSTSVRDRDASRAPAAARRLSLVAQAAIAMVVLVGAALFVRTERALRATELGFDAERLLVLALSPQNAGSLPADTLPFFRAARDRVSALPGVSAVTYGWIRPLLNATWESRVTMAGCCAGGVTSALRNAVGPGYFGALGIPLVAGRDFTAADDGAAPRVAIVNETFARMHGREELLGARIGVARAEYTIVGIAKDATYANLREAPAPVWFVPYEQQPGVKYLDMFVRTTGSPAQAIGSVRAAIASVDPQVALFEVRPLQAQVDRLLVVERMLSVLGMFFGAAAAVLAGLGLYGILAWVVAARTREIGVRLALGATPASVVLDVTADAWKALAIGIVLGAVAAAIAAQFLGALLYGVSPLDPVSFAAGVAVLAVLVTAAAAIPLRRASRTDPVVALRDA